MFIYIYIYIGGLLRLEIESLIDFAPTSSNMSLYIVGSLGTTNVFITNTYMINANNNSMHINIAYKCENLQISITDPILLEFKIYDNNSQQV